MKKGKRTETVKAWAWEFPSLTHPGTYVLCFWAEPERERLLWRGRPSAGARPRKVRIIRERDYVALARAEGKP